MVLTPRVPKALVGSGRGAGVAIDEFTVGDSYRRRDEAKGWSAPDAPPAGNDKSEAREDEADDHAGMTHGRWGAAHDGARFPAADCRSRIPDGEVPDRHAFVHTLFWAIGDAKWWTTPLAARCERGWPAMPPRKWPPVVDPPSRRPVSEPAYEPRR